MEPDNPKVIWGFDLGTASVGFAAVEYDDKKREGKILRLGVRVFPEGVEEKRRAPRNLARRQARLMRRQIRRRRWRKRHLRAALVDAGLLPKEEREPSSRATEFFSKRNDPYELRAKAVREKLENPFDIGRVLFHLSKHRAFMGSRKFGEIEEKEPEKLGKKALQMRERLEKEIAAGRKEPQPAGDEESVKPEIELHKAKMGGRFLGEYLQKDFAYPNRKRGWHFQRVMVEDEFDRIWKKQSEFHDALKDEKRRERIRHIIFDQRPTYFRPSTVGKCDLEPTEDRCLKADWRAQQFVMLQMLNSLRLSGDRPISKEQRNLILNRIQASGRVAFKTLRGKKALNLEDEFNFERGGKKEMLGNVTEARLAEAFGDGWQTLLARDKIRDEIAERLWYVEYRLVHNGKRAEIRDWKDIAAKREKFAVAAQRDWGVTAEQAKALSNISLPDGHAMHSKAAILKMLPFLEQGFRYDEAKDKAYPDRQAANGKNDRLPPPPAIRNPTVMRTLNELRNVANNLLRVHGRPDLIRVELARDLKVPSRCPPGRPNCGRCRRCIMRRIDQNETSREKAKEELAKANIVPKGSNIEKYLLAEEQGWRCPYTVDEKEGHISFEGLFQTGLFEVDHVLPRARSLDNTFANKVVCHRDANRDKARRTPYEAWGKDKDRWTQILGILDRMLERNHFPLGKINRIKTEDYPAAGSDEFTERQLRDTAYASRAAREYLGALGVKVDPANGKVTRNLRHLWGLDKILSDDNEKNRNDHRHHAIDALTVALTTPAFIKRASEYYAADIRPHDEKLSEQLKERVKKSFQLPWETIHADAERAANEIIVSHRAQRKVSGALHDQMPWGDRGPIDTRGRKHLYVQGDKEDRKQTALVRAIGPEAKAGHPIDERSRPGWVPTNSNHHMIIYKKDGKLDREIVSLFDVAMRVSNREPIVNRAPKAGVPFWRSLCIGDMLEWKKQYWVVKKLESDGRITIQPHDAAQMSERNSGSAISYFQEGARKVVVDPIGRVFPAND
ncbi:MAG: type II CRISPR RNA-guided endonuclease Cas9 [Candidatus Binataceae bacterium]